MMRIEIATVYKARRVGVAAVAQVVGSTVYPLFQPLHNKRQLLVFQEFEVVLPCVGTLQATRGGVETGYAVVDGRSEEHTSELQSLMRISYAVFCLKKKKTKQTYKYQQITKTHTHQHTTQYNE